MTAPPGRGEDSGGAPPSSRTLSALGPIAPRDTNTTAFTAILEDLLGRVPGAYAVMLVDNLGETVDYTGRGDPFDLRIAAAHLQLVLQSIDRLKVLGEARWVVVRGQRRSIAATGLPDGYALALLLQPRAAFRISTRALKVCMRALAAEAGWSAHPHDAKERSWVAVTVATDGRGRPVAVGDPPLTVEVLGTVVGLSVGERGFRVRTSEGSELMLVREARRRWYADEPIQPASASGPNRSDG
jgi:hypothetical protein